MTEIIKKLTTRNYLAVLTGTGLVGLVGYGVLHPTAAADAISQPLIAYLLGQFTTAAALVYAFYFRKAQSKESVAQ